MYKTATLFFNFYIMTNNNEPTLSAIDYCDPLGSTNDYAILYGTQPYSRTIETHTPPPIDRIIQTQRLSLLDTGLNDSN